MWRSRFQTLTAGSVLPQWLLIDPPPCSCPWGWGDAMPENVQEFILAISSTWGAFQAGER